MKSAPPIAFDYRPSRRIAAAALALAALALACATLNDLPAGLRLLLVPALLAAVAVGLWRFLHPPFRRVAWGGSGWLLIDRQGDAHAATLVGQRRLGNLLALDFRCPTRAPFRPLLASDNLDADTRRRLVLTLARADIAPAP
ncbi:MAG: hypothetical protein J0H15_06700 [Xanthomonadales bacterium]|nr:hypothetical protein [Xanthomonadales bacterium]